jgi:hypothetical protein
MNIHTKIGLAALALALSCGPMLSQDGPDGAAAGQQGGRERFGPGGPQGPGGELGGWGHRHGGFGRGERGGRREFGLSRLLSDPDIRTKVGISAEQAAKIRQQESAFRKTAIRQRADLEVKRIDLRDLLSADKPDRAAIDSKLQEISASQLAAEKSRVDFRLNTREAITPEQREKLRQALRDRWQGRGGAGRRGPGARGQSGGGPNRPPGPDAQGQPKPGE